jgi:hypothetical protein
MRRIKEKTKPLVDNQEPGMPLRNPGTEKRKFENLTLEINLRKK